MKSINNVITKTSPKPGTTVAVFCGVHGNERAGILTVDRLAKELEVIAGTVHLVYANPPAIEKNVRLVNADLNRLFLRRDAPSASYEYGRAADLMDLLDECDALLDLHSYPAPVAPAEAVPFAICEPISYPLAALFDVPIVVSGFTDAEGGGSDGYMFLNGKPGICVELGANERPDLFVNLGLDTAKRFLAHFGCVATRHPPLATRHQQHLALKTFYKKTHEDFRLIREFKNLERLQANEPIAVVNGLVLKAESDSHIIFPYANRPVGIEAFLLAKECSVSVSASVTP